MLRKILVPLDGSPSAEDALPIARRLARRRNASVELVMVRDLPVEPLTIHTPSTDAQMLDETDFRMAQDYLDSVARRLKDAGVDATGTVMDGEVIASIRQRVRETEADIVVMCTHGRGGWSRFWLGSVAQELVRRLHVPLLLTRPHGELEGQASPPPEDGALRILVTLDGSHYAEQALDAAIRSFGTETTEYTLLRVVVPPIVRPYRVPKAHPDYVEQERLTKLATEYLEGQVKSLRERGVKADYGVIARQHVAEAIADYAVEHGLHGIAIATNARQGMPRLVLGSVADKVLRSSIVPVMVIRSPHAGEVPEGA